ncbi:MAG: glycoside hydrolase/phage tail family protein [Parvibaculaceae bacterium]
MASVLLSAAGSALGSSLLPAGANVLGANVSGAAIGKFVGNAAGSLIDRELFGTTVTREGPRLDDLNVQGSTEGVAIPRAYGRVRLAGQVIWSTRFKETAQTSASETGGGKGGSGNSVETTTYAYSVSFAVALCEGPIARIGGVWADGHLLDLTGITYRLHRGTETQGPDSTIEAVEGAGNVPAYKGVAYIVFDDLPLAEFGNRLPQLTFEIYRPLNGIEDSVRAVTIIPGASEFGYDPQPFRRVFADGVSRTENRNNRLGGTDWSVSLDDLQATCPNLSAAALVVAWFGDDLRCGACTVRPKTDTADKVTVPEPWQVAGLDRGTAQTVSTVDGRPAFGGTPSDATVKRAIEDMKARGLAVTYYPFLLMDVAAGNGLPDPYGGAEQGAYPWRGRLTVHPAPGHVGSPDKSAAAAADVAAFFGTASASDFAVTAGGIAYSGPDEWSYRRMVLHQAALCAWAGGVETFLIGSELRGLTHLRDGPASYPAVAALVALAAEVRALLGPATKLSYAADWSEYFGHHPQDGSGDVFFHLDPLWADTNIDFVGIDNYMPLADWRDGLSHADRVAGTPHVYDLDYLQGNIAGGEGYDWFYASSADRAAQVRTPITDGAHGKPWTFRYKDIESWWANAHHNRPGGVESVSPTAWVPQSKPLWFTELGCPAIDKGANQPNVFVDPKSAESAAPYFSSGLRDDYMQRRFLEAHLTYWADPANNPVSPVYGGPMVADDRLFVWTWDARPFPAFPSLEQVWADGGNWQLGHWITGRLGAVPLGLLVQEIAGAVGPVPLAFGDLTGLVDGFVIDRIMSPRQALEPLMLAYFFDAAESEGVLKFRHRAVAPVRTLTPDTLAVADEEAAAGYTLVRGQETELPFSVKLTYIDPDAGYRQAAVEARRETVLSERVSSAALPIVLRQAAAQRIADILLREIWVKRDRASLALPPSALALDPGDAVTLDLGSRRTDLRLTGLTDAHAIEADAVRSDPEIFGLLAAPERAPDETPLPTYGAPDVAFLDLPLLSGAEVPHAPHIAVAADPWPGGVALYRSATGSGFRLDTVVDLAATMGRTVTALAAGPVSRWDRANRVRVRLGGGTLQSVDTLALLDGANLAALETVPGVWEVIQFGQADLVDTDTYDLSLLLRGQGGTEDAMAALLPAGARFVLLNGVVTQIGLRAAERGLALQWRYGPKPYSLDDETYKTETRSFAGLGLRPLSPVHVTARRLANGDIDLRWVRRTRIDGDSWAGLDVPLGEELEAYEVDILDGVTVLRTLAAHVPTVTYAAADQAADFGSSSFPALAVRVVQVSRAFGRGAPQEVLLNV